MKADERNNEVTDEHNNEATDEHNNEVTDEHYIYFKTMNTIMNAIMK